MYLDGQGICDEASHLTGMNLNDGAAANNLQDSVVDTTAHRFAVDMKQLSHFLNGQHPL